MMSQILGQKTMPWGNEKLGTSKYYIWAKGCFITELAECLGLTPDVVNQKLNAVGGFKADTTGEHDEVIWAKVAEAFPGWNATFVSPYDNDAVKAALAAGHSVIVQVPADPIGAPGGLHAVRYIGDHKLHDPWTASERPTSDFPNPTAFNVISKVVVPVEPPAPVAPTESTLRTYGLDDTNIDSKQVVYDTWNDVKNGLYVKADEYINALKMICEALGISETNDIATIVNHITTLKEDFKKQVLVSTGLPAAEQVEGQGAPITPAAPVVTLVNLPPHEKNAVLAQFEAAAVEVKKLLGL